MTAQDVEKDIRMNTHAHRVIELAQPHARCPDTVGKIADLIGYKP